MNARKAGRGRRDVWGKCCGVGVIRFAGGFGVGLAVVGRGVLVGLGVFPGRIGSGVGEVVAGGAAVAVTGAAAGSGFCPSVVASGVGVAAMGG